MNILKGVNWSLHQIVSGRGSSTIQMSVLAYSSLVTYFL